MKDNHIQYIEFQATDLEEMKQFYSSVFGWTFTDYGDDYTAFENSGVSGGFAKTERVTQGGPLVVLYHQRLELAREHVIRGGGTISKDIFSFPGGRRFHFIDPGKNELAVWSDK
jgi:predicted enzyme related to lactoylglutathione lyase